MSNVYDQYLDEAGQQLAQDIDTQLLMELLGWHGMNVSTGTVYGSKYHTAEPTWSDSSKMTGFYNHDWNKMLEWCVETFGPCRAAIWGERAPVQLQRWYANNAKFWFKDEADLMMFMLRWS